MQSSSENADCCGKCESALKILHSMPLFLLIFYSHTSGSVVTNAGGASPQPTGSRSPSAGVWAYISLTLLFNAAIIKNALVMNRGSQMLDGTGLPTTLA